MKRCTLVSVALFLISGSLPAAAPVRDGQKGTSEFSPSHSQGFSSLLVVTTDDWKAKWRTPSDNTPELVAVTKLKRDIAATILVLFSSPLRDKEGNVDVVFDIKITQPDGKLLLAQKDLPGLTGPLKTDPSHVYLADGKVDFIGEASDPSGVWVVEAVVRDRHAKVNIPLRATFELVK